MELKKNKCLVKIHLLGQAETMGHRIDFNLYSPCLSFLHTVNLYS